MENKEFKPSIEFIRLAFLKTVRSVSLTRNLISGLFTYLMIFFIFLYLVGIAVFLEPLIKSFTETESAIPALNTYIIFFFLFEMMYRFFLQKRPLFDIQSFLHLPVKRSQIIYFLLGRSFITPHSLVVIILFMPITLSAIRIEHGAEAALQWILTLILISYTLHWFVLWYKQRFDNSTTATVAIVSVPLLASVLLYFSIFNIGEITHPFFQYALDSPLPLVLFVVLCAASFRLVFQYYMHNAYVEDVHQGSAFRFGKSGPGFFSRFGLLGEIADVELKLIFRHKKSRSYFILSFALLFYGLLFYPGAVVDSAAGEFLLLFVAIFITGAFFLQYGQLFLSWNSSSFDFFLSRENGLEALIKGKFLLLAGISLLLFLLSLPYVYFGWKIIAFHTAAFLYNVGIGVHLIIILALWEPKPMDLGKGAFFNYEGVGVAQFLMIFPYLVFPYAIYIPANMFFGTYTALFILGLIGAIGLVFHDKLIGFSVRKLQRGRYKISSTFRQEL